MGSFAVQSAEDIGATADAGVSIESAEDIGTYPDPTAEIEAPLLIGTAGESVAVVHAAVYVGPEFEVIAVILPAEDVPARGNGLGSTLNVESLVDIGTTVAPLRVEYQEREHGGEGHEQRTHQLEFPALSVLPRLTSHWKSFCIAVQIAAMTR